MIYETLFNYSIICSACEARPARHRSNPLLPLHPSQVDSLDTGWIVDNCQCVDHNSRQHRNSRANPVRQTSWIVSEPIMADQNERAFQKQPTVFLNKKGGLKASESRWTCNPGLGFKIPSEAKTGNYIDKKCPFTGKVNLE